MCQKYVVIFIHASNTINVKIFPNSKQESEFKFYQDE